MAGVTRGAAGGAARRAAVAVQPELPAPGAAGGDARAGSGPARPTAAPVRLAAAPARPAAGASAAGGIVEQAAAGDGEPA